jgi:hypothetical protein
MKGKPHAMIAKLCVAGPIFAGLILAAVAGGCSQGMGGTSRSLGDVPYEHALAAGRQVMAQHFPLARIDEGKGLIVSQSVPIAGQRLVGGATQRQVARLQVRRQGGAASAEAIIEVQQQSSRACLMNGPQGGFEPSSAQTPAQVEAATTPQQNEMWVTVRRNRPLEARLLEQVYDRLHAPPASQPRS